VGVGRLAAAAAGIFVLAAASPDGSDGGHDDNGAWQSVVGVTLLMTTWIGGCAHAVAASATWLRWRSRRRG
jgi:hypothetical protein